MTQFINTLVGIFQSSGFARFGEPGGWLYAIMICVGCFLLYLAIVKEYEPLILLPMAFGMILANLPGSPNRAKPELWKIPTRVSINCVMLFLLC